MHPRRMSEIAGLGFMICNCFMGLIIVESHPELCSKIDNHTNLLCK